jgi:hypothetical protein
MRILRPTGTFFICILWFGIEVFAPPERGRLRIGLRFIISFACCRLCHTLSFFWGGVSGDNDTEGPVARGVAGVDKF